jgi:hypothetical protein
MARINELRGKMGLVFDDLKMKRLNELLRSCLTVGGDLNKRVGNRRIRELANRLNEFADSRKDRTRATKRDS